MKKVWQNVISKEFFSAFPFQVLSTVLFIRISSDSIWLSVVSVEVKLF